MQISHSRVQQANSSIHLPDRLNPSNYLIYGPIANYEKYQHNGSIESWLYHLLSESFIYIITWTQSYQYLVSILSCPFHCLRMIMCNSVIQYNISNETRIIPLYETYNNKLPINTFITFVYFIDLDLWPDWYGRKFHHHHNTMIKNNLCNPNLRNNMIICMYVIHISMTLYMYHNMTWNG